MSENILFGLVLAGLILSVIGVIIACFAMWHHPKLHSPEARAKAGLAEGVNPASIIAALGRDKLNASTSEDLGTGTGVLPLGKATTPVQVASLAMPAHFRPKTGQVVTSFEVQKLYAYMATPGKVSTVSVLGAEVKVGVSLTAFGDLIFNHHSPLMMELRIGSATNPPTLVPMIPRDTGIAMMLDIAVESIIVPNIVITPTTTSVPFFLNVSPVHFIGATPSVLQTSTKPITITFNPHKQMSVRVLNRHPASPDTIAGESGISA